MMPCQPFSRLFFALRPPPAAAEHIGRSWPWLAPAGRRVAAGRLHVTLNLVGDWPLLPPDLVEALAPVGDAVRAAPFRVVFDRLCGNGEVALIRPSEAVPALDALQRRLAAALARAGLGRRRGARFSPHVTLAYRAGRSLDEWTEPVSWEVRDFVLIESRIPLARHVLRGRWRLR
ncbi:MAG TPA: 2'-5' RNA ligase family protein [Allosphingosinicella sp.]|nr:2'-5' RNA ligase family protein [Allosphingosinicella sp.]